MFEWWWWMLAATVAFAAWRWCKEESWLRMTWNKGLVLVLVVMAALCCWRKETGSWLADGFFAIAILAMFVLMAADFRRRRHRGATEREGAP